VKYKLNNAYWVGCNIHGTGKTLELAVCKKNDDGDTMLFFPFSDFDDYAENYEDKIAFLVEKPLQNKVEAQKGRR